MQIIPAVYIFNGKCVALYKGSFEHKKIYPMSPLDYVKNFVAKGVSCIYLIDLDASEFNKNTNYELIENIRREIKVPLILGGRIRTMQEVDMWFEKGFDRLVLGVSAEPVYKTAIEKYGAEKIIIGIKAKGDEVQTDIKTKFPIRVIDFAEKLPILGVERVMFKDIWKESTQIGPNYDEVDRMIRMLSLKVYVSGGISKRKHFKLLNKIGSYAAVVGKAFYEGDIKVSDIVFEFEEDRK